MRSAALIMSRSLAMLGLSVLASASALTLIFAVWGAQFASGSTPLEDFERYDNGAFPDRWHGRNDEAHKIYRVETEIGGRFLRAHADRQAAQIGLEHVFEPKQQRRLTWRWRVHQLPTGAEERNGDKHDAAAQVYVIFDNQCWPRVIKYIWSAALPVGTRFVNPLYGRSSMAFVLTMAVTQGWRVLSEFLRGDYRGHGSVSAYQIMGITAIAFAGIHSYSTADHVGITADLAAGIEALWHAEVLLALQMLWALVFVMFGQSRVTGAQISFHLREDRI